MVAEGATVTEPWSFVGSLVGVSDANVLTVGGGEEQHTIVAVGTDVALGQSPIISAITEIARGAANIPSQKPRAVVRLGSLNSKVTAETRK